MPKHGVTVAIALMVGCAAGAATAQLVVPAARAGTNPTRWEYACKDDLAKAEGGFEAAINKYGAEGWEMVGAGRLVGASYGYEWTACFKRALP